VLRHAVLILVSAFFLIPFLWTVSMSLKGAGQLLEYPPRWIPSPVRWQNYVRVFDVLPFARFYANTIVISLLVVGGDLVMGSLVAYGFARFRFPGREVLFLLLISVLMLPAIVVLVPEFILMKELGWLGSMRPLWIPHLFGGSPVIVFLFRQYFLSIPMDLDEAARIDGAGPLRVFAQVLAPMCKPVYISAAIFSWMGVWNDFLRPLVYLRTKDLFTLAIGLKALRDAMGGGVSSKPMDDLLMAGAILSMVPALLIFLVGQRYFIKGVELQFYK
jgi:ABC-type glycerol-3-phosphate transport system permease component